MKAGANQEPLGQLLVRAGRLGQDALDRALEAQQLVGGRLGTTLLEKGFIGESALLEALGSQRSTCTAGRAELSHITPAVLRSVPEKLARRYRLVPYEVRGKTLYIASCDPGDLLWEEEISFLTSFMVRTCIALELHVMMALRQYYGIRVPARFISLAKRLRSGAVTPSTGASRAPSAPPAPPASTSSASTSSASTSSASTSPASTSALPTPTAPTTGTISTATTSTATNVTPGAAQAKPATPAPAPDVEFIELDPGDLAKLRGPGDAARGDSAPGERLAEGVTAGEPPIGAQARPAPSGGVEGGDEAGQDEIGDETENDLDATPFDDDALDGFSLSPDDDPETRLIKAGLALGDADIRDEIGDVLLATSGTYFARRLLLIARRGHIVGWRGAGDGVDEESVRTLELDEKAPSIFAGLRDTDSFWLGPLPPLPANQRLLEVLGRPAPKSCLALPIVLRSKVVAHLYADNLGGTVTGAPLADMKRLVAKAGLAFEVYILKNKIRML